jgi:hypothetical protein
MFNIANNRIVITTVLVSSLISFVIFGIVTSAYSCLIVFIINKLVVQQKRILVYANALKRKRLIDDLRVSRWLPFKKQQTTVTLAFTVAPGRLAAWRYVGTGTGLTRG